MSFESYIKEYSKLLQLVRKETYKTYQTEAEMLFEFIDNWIDLIPTGEELYPQAIHSLSGIILLNSWKLTNWISYEILSGKYFEAIRNLRFMFEGCVYAIILEDAIERIAVERWGSLSQLSLKAEIFRLWENCKKNKWRVYRKGKIQQDVIWELTADFVHRNIPPSKKDDAPEYIEAYVEILSNKKLYLSTSRMINECAVFLELEEQDIRPIKELWHELSKYLHFSFPSLEAFIDDPELCVFETLNEALLKRCLTFYFQTLDFFYAVLVWRFKALHKKLRELCEWWKTNFNKTFTLTEKLLKNTEN